MAPKFLGYLHAKYVTQNKCAKIRKFPNSAVRGPILMKFWHQILWPQTVLMVPSDLNKTRLGLSIDSTWSQDQSPGSENF